MRLGCLGRVATAVVGLALLLLVALLPSAAQAHATGWHIDRYHVSVDVADDGTMDVTIDMDYDFGGEPGHGPYITLPTRMGYDEEHDRLYEVTDISASSATGAPARTYVQRTGSRVEIRVGDADRGDISGVHQYTIRYRMRGMLNAAAGGGPYDELYWNVIGTDWEIPLGDLAVTVRGPQDVAAVTCFAGGAGSTASCATAESGGPVARFTHPGAAPGQGMTIVVGWPAGTFTAVAPILEEKPHVADPFAPASPGGLLGGLGFLGGVAAVLTLLARQGRDEAYLGVTPGLAPVPGTTTAVGRRRRRDPVAVRFEPPAEVRPGVVGTLFDEVADTEDVTATLVDLAVRGYLRIEEVPRKDPRKTPKQWRLVKTRKLDPSLAPFERTLLQGLFTGRDSVTTKELDESFVHTLTAVKSALYEEVTGRGWFRSSPDKVRMRWYLAGIALLVLGFFGFFVAFSWEGGPDGLVFVPVALWGVALAVLFGAKRAPARTADGSAVLAQTLGFRRYLSTAEADRLRWEEGEDLFSRYLPYAIAFRETRRWARVFADLAARGARVPEPSWYVAGYGTSLWAGDLDFSSRFASFTSTASHVISSSPASSGSSGGSGFSGGSVGGGGGGGGGGGW